MAVSVEYTRSAVYRPFESRLLAAQTLFSALRCTAGDGNSAIYYYDSYSVPWRGAVHHETQVGPVLEALDSTGSLL